MSSTTNHLSRTDSFELVQEQIAKLERQATALTTGARSYTEIADDIEARATRGAISDECVAEVVAYVRQKASTCALAAANKRTMASMLNANALR